jgi:hypothetical protein
MAHPKETQLALRAAFLSGSPLDLAAVQCGIGTATARRWKADALAQGDDWDKFQKASLIVAGGGFDQAMGRVAAAVILRAEAILEQLGGKEEPDPVAEAKAIASLADSLGKAKAAMRALMPQTDRLGVAMEVIKRLDAFIRENHPQQAGFFAELLPVFGQELAKEL